MPRARSPNRDKAKELWLKSNKKRELKDIAAELGVSAEQVRKWKNEDKWDKGNVTKTKSNVTKHRGGQPGNKNAVGAGAPPGNDNATKHGGYKSVVLDTLNEDERSIFESVTDDAEALLIEEIQIFSIRERRLLQAINKYRNIRGGLAVNNVLTSHTKRAFDKDDIEGKQLYDELKREKIEENKISYLGYDQYTQTGTEATINIIQRLEAELTRVQRAKTQAIEQLYKLRCMNKEENGGDKALVDDWCASVDGGDIYG